MVLLGTAAPFSCTKPVAADSTPPEKKDTTPDDPSKDNPQTPELKAISLSPTEVSLEEGSSKILTLTLDPADFSRDGIKWTSSDNNVATVSGGKITAVAKGTAVVKVALAGKEASCNVTVTEKSTPEPPAEWDGKTFIDRTAEWQAEFKEYPGANNSTYWTFEIATCTTKYHLVKFVCEGEDYYAPSDICHSPVNIASAYNFFCVDVDESYLMNALQTRLPDWEEIAWVTGMGHAQGYAFGFNKDKKFTGEYAHITSEHVF